MMRGQTIMSSADESLRDAEQVPWDPWHGCIHSLYCLR